MMGCLWERCRRMVVEPLFLIAECRRGCSVMVMTSTGGVLG